MTPKQEKKFKKAVAKKKAERKAKAAAPFLSACMMMRDEEENLPRSEGDGAGGCRSVFRGDAVRKEIKFFKGSECVNRSGERGVAFTRRFG